MFYSVQTAYNLCIMSMVHTETMTEFSMAPLYSCNLSNKNTAGRTSWPWMMQHGERESKALLRSIPLPCVGFLFSLDFIQCLCSTPSHRLAFGLTMCNSRGWQVFVAGGNRVSNHHPPTDQKSDRSKAERTGLWSWFCRSAVDADLLTWTVNN